MDNSFKNLIDSASEVLILLPIDPSVDEVASGLSLFLGMSGLKPAGISCPTPTTVSFSRLVGVDRVTTDLGNKNLVIGFAGYKAANIEKVSYDIENEEFRLTVVPKTGFVAPTKEQVAVHHSGVSADCVIIIGGDNQTSFPALSDGAIPANAKIVHIGTSLIAMPPEKQVMSFARTSSSISELMLSLMLEIGVKVDPDVATNLLAGIEEGSGGFSTIETTADTFITVAELIKMGGLRMKKTIPAESYPKGSIPTAPFTDKPVMQTQNTDAIPEQQDVPQSWTEPKIYKGASVS